jgi:CubicO group peptidase (beta-lactamase class C family)
MRAVLPIIAAVMLAACASPRGAGLATLDGDALTPASIDATTQRLMAANDVKGLALALIRDGQVVYVHAYGLRDVEHNLPLETDTIMYGASLTKATFTTMVLQLVDEGRLDLDKPIADYLPKPLPEYEDYSSLAGDERWRRLTARMLLDHTSGFANLHWLEPDQKLHFHRDPGTRYGYSGEGFYLLQFVLEQGLGLDVGAEMQRRVFARFGMSRTSMTWRADFAANLADGYDINGARRAHDHRDNVSAAGSMDTTIADWSKFLAAVSRGEALSAASWAEMTRRQIEIDSVAQFPTLRDDTTEANKAIGLGYGLGWGVFETPFGHAFFKEGHDDGTANYALCIAARRDCVLLMSNSVRAEGIFLPLVDALIGHTNLPWAWEGYAPYDRAGAAP